MSKKYRFRSNGPMTVGLVSTRLEPIHGPMGEVLATKKIPPVKAVFNNGFYETDDEKIKILLTSHMSWGSDIFWDPTCLPKESTPADKDTAKQFAKSESARKDRKSKGIRNAKEGSVAKEQ